MNFSLVFEIAAGVVLAVWWLEYPKRSAERAKARAEEARFQREMETNRQNNERLTSELRARDELKRQAEEPGAAGDEARAIIAVAERTQEWEQYKNWLKRERSNEASPPHWPDYQTGILDCLIWYNNQFGWPLPWEPEDKAECARILAPHALGEPSVDPHKPVEKDWIVELVDPSSALPERRQLYPKTFRWKGDAEQHVAFTTELGGEPLSMRRKGAT
jgi:hypothetical protein